MYCKNCGNKMKAGEKFCVKCGTPIDIPTVGTPRKKLNKIVPLIIAVCGVGIFISVCSLVKGNNDDLEGVSQKNDLSLLTQIENEYGIEIPGMEAADGSAVDNIALEEYLPSMDSRRFTTVINSDDNTENLIEEMTIDTVDNGEYNYSVYNYLADFTVQGVIFPDKSNEFYCTRQENMFDSSLADMDFYIGLPGKNWTLEKKNEDTTVKMYIASEFYTITTPYGSYENCLLKYEHTLCETDSWANNISFTAYAPCGIGKIYSVAYSEDSLETPLTYYTYIPVDSYSDLAVMELSPEIQTILDNSSQYTSDEGLILAFSNGTTDLWVINPNSNMINYHGNRGPQKNRDGWPVTGDSSIGCGNEVLNFYDLEDGRRQAELTLWGDFYYFTEESTENSISNDTDISQDVPDDGMIIADIMDDEASDLWTSGNGTSALTLAMRLESGGMHVYLFSVHAMEILYSGVIGTTTADEIYIIGDSEYGEGKIVYLSDNELELTVDNEVYVFNIL